MRDTSIVILSYNNLEYTEDCINSIRDFTESGTYEIIVVDNASSDNSVSWLKEQHDIKLIVNTENKGFPAACNQGMRLAEPKNDILLLNNDVIVTKNWLANMKTALYSDEKVGAVGAITNSCSYYQQIKCNYETMDEMFKFAEKNNVSSPKKWEQRAKLIAFCMLIRREVVDVVGGLDEIFTPGNFEDDDYSFRIIVAGYKLLLCRDVFIHHFGGLSFGRDKAMWELMERNERKLFDKWGIDNSEHLEINYGLIEKMDKPEDSKLNILDLGCGCGTTLLAAKNKYPHANLFGVDKNPNPLKIAQSFAKVFVSEAEKIMFIDTPTELTSNKFDYIILGEIIEYLENPVALLAGLKALLKPDGKILMCVANGMYIENILEYIVGTIKSELRRDFSYITLVELIERAGYTKYEISAEHGREAESRRQQMEAIMQISNKDFEKIYSISRYLVAVGE